MQAPSKYKGTIDVDRKPKKIGNSSHQLVHHRHDSTRHTHQHQCEDEDNIIAKLWKNCLDTLWPLRLLTVLMFCQSYLMIACPVLHAVCFIVECISHYCKQVRQYAGFLLGTLSVHCLFCSQYASIMPISRVTVYDDIDRVALSALSI